MQVNLPVPQVNSAGHLSIGRYNEGTVEGQQHSIIEETYTAFEIGCAVS